MTTPYTTGQISLVNGEALVTGIGTGWATSLIIGGTIYVEADGGNALPIDEITSDTEITSAIVWKGPTGTYDYALVRDTAYGQQTVANAQALADYIQRLNSTALSAVAGVSPSANMLILFTGPDSATLINADEISGSGLDFDKEVNDLAGRAIYDTSAANFRVAVANIGDGRSAVYVKKSDTAGDWSDPLYITGRDGTNGTDGADGEDGAPGAPGAPGSPGPYTTINPGTVTTLAPGSQATASFAPVSSGVVQLNLGIPAGQNGTGSGTVTSVGLSVPTGLQVSVASITTTGTFAITYQSGYQGYTTVEANKLAGIQTGAQVNQTVGTTSGTVAAGDDSRFNNNGKLNVEDQTLTGGARVTSKDLGTISTGTLTLDPGDRPLQHYTNNGAHTLAPGTNTGSFMLDITNGASAGAITVTGWTKVAGDAFTTTSGNKFRLHCSVGNGGSLLIVQALQ
ncbi:hypothetical protein HRR99_03350 [Agrobacterium vaccinii]|uniref:hypothetical protein n=1 Tax=Agrobacterium vaccinii TaxID=2735528 RepID=UPI001E56F29F|nr:hypothetical protein [Agrobacterium vaccinii]UHS60622.1 hypothetical protein HRR99_03350 [Agrobacterium vaccinii]